MLSSLKSKGAFAKVLDAQEKYKPKSHDLGFVVYAAQNSIIDCIGLGLIVPKRAYKLAVDRNRIKRLARAACQNMFCAEELPKKGLVKRDLVLLVRSKAKLHTPQSSFYSKAMFDAVTKALTHQTKAL